MLIAISAAAYNSGKDTVADIIIEHAKNKKYKKLQFSRPLKELVASLIGCRVENLEDQDFKRMELGPEWNYQDSEDIKYYSKIGVDTPFIRRTVRNLLIAIGDGMRDLVGDTVWANAAKAKYDNRKEGYDYILTDWRYPNGETILMDHNPNITIRVIRPGEPIIQSPSERSLDHYIFDETIINDGTLEELKEKVLRIINKYKI